MRSARRYPPRRCINSDCNLLFTPHDRRQVHCTKQCQINKNNDIKNEKAAVERQLKRLQQSDTALALLYWNASGQALSFIKTLLLQNGVDLTIGELEPLRRTKDFIRWYVAYGLEPCPGLREEEYWIVRREDFLLHRKG